MNYIAITIAVLFILGFLLYQMTKSHLLTALSKQMQDHNYDEVLRLSDKPMYHKILGDYVCELYLLRALLNKGEEDQFKEKLDEALHTSFSLEQIKEMLDIYYYHFLFNGDFEWAEKLLERIRETNDMPYITYNQEAFEVMANKRCDLLEDMIDKLDNKGYSGLGLGIAVFMIGMQYLYLGDKDNARTYFYNSLSCFNAKSFYAAQAQSYVDRLTEELDADELDY